MTDAASLKARLHDLETQLAQHTERRQQATQVLNESQTAILQLQGAIALLHELLTPAEAPTGSPNDEDQLSMRASKVS